MNLKKNKKLLLILLIFCCCFIAVGYLVLAQALDLKGRFKINDAKWDIRFTDITTFQIDGTVDETTAPILNAHDIQIFAEFNNVGDSITYDITVKNNGNLDAELSSIIVTPANNDYVQYDIRGIDVGDILKASESRKLKASFKYEPKSEILDEKYQDIKILFDWKQVT